MSSPPPELPCAVSPDAPPHTDALYYPFHLCHPRTLQRLLQRFRTVHFRDYMAIQLTALSGTTAYSDRMGDGFPDLVESGRIVQGLSVSGPLSGELITAVDRDLADDHWRATFHEWLRSDRRFQRGLFDPSHAMTIGTRTVPGPAALLELMSTEYRHRRVTVADVQRLSVRQAALEDAYTFEYGLSLVKTAAALAYTVQLSLRHRLSVATDCPGHYALLERTCARDGKTLMNWLVDRQGY